MDIEYHHPKDYNKGYKTLETHHSKDHTKEIQSYKENSSLTSQRLGFNTKL
jgi:hypothetical protein